MPYIKNYLAIYVLRIDWSRSNGLSSRLNSLRFKRMFSGRNSPEDKSSVRDFKWCNEFKIIRIKIGTWKVLHDISHPCNSLVRVMRASRLSLWFSGRKINVITLDSIKKP